ncbi:MAG: hypothetical protein R3C59_14275 [Planctomycetaceae bacterium]
MMSPRPFTISQGLISLSCSTVACWCLAASAFAGDRFLITDADGFSGGSIRDVALSQDGTWLAVAGEKQVRVWNVRTGTLKASIRGYQLAPHLKLGRANAVAFSPDDQYLITGVSDNVDEGSTRMYRMDDLDTLKDLLPGHTACSDRVAFSEDGTWFASYG